MSALMREPRQFERLGHQDDRSDDFATVLPCLAGFTAGDLFPILDGLQAALETLESLK